MPQGNTTTKYRGTITNEATGNVIVGALIEIEGTNLTTSSDITGKAVIEYGEICIKDLSGKILKCFTISQNTDDVLISTIDLTPGCYIIDLNNNGKHISSIKLVKAD